MKKIAFLVLIAASTFTLIQSCSKSGNSTPDKNNGSSFDRGAMLTNISTNIILPGYTAYQADAVTLDAAVTTFNTTPNAINLTAAQNAFIATYKAWQSVSMYEFGPAAAIQLQVNTNTFPASVDVINANITSGTYNPALLSNLPAKGLPALDYLLFGTGADNTAILAQYTTDSQAAHRKTYLATLTTEVKTNATTVLNQWTASYKTTFASNTGTDAGSSTSLLVNQLIYDYENLKNYEIGVPAGVQTSGQALPAKVQAYYSKISLALAKLHLQAVQNLYMGASGQGLDDYLVFVKAQYNGGSLNDAITAQFATSLAKLNGLTDPLSANIISNQAAVTATYTELQKLTVLLKTDMTSSLGILITFGDNDGD
ncbi:imelysin family protein [Mucilaginibacter sp. dw_454]|uniref:imelysin family protein n=1 Tax=Mucilaginibacter sp. dw_454 TaxID=2720079 RepID=UPI001BD54BE0|nr:imelysin family protein [Mucilaginibacter sp. dw_454]